MMMNQNEPGRTFGKPKSVSNKLLSLLLVIVILTGAFLLFRWMLATKPKAKHRHKMTVGTIVEVQTAQLSNEKIIIEAMGTVIAAKTISLTSQVSGEIIEVSPNLQPGSYFRQAEKMLSIDSADYKLGVQQKEADVVQARSELALEYGNQLVAKREFELLGEKVSAEELDLILRKPQLKKLEASLKAAESGLEQAKLDLARTEVRAPFNGVVETLQVNLGARVNSGTELVTFTGVDEFWIKILVPVNKLKWITIADSSSNSQGSTVQIYNESAWGKDIYRTGEVIRLMPGLEKSSQMAQLIVRIEDPLSLKDQSLPKLLLGSYVSVSIDCGHLENVIAVNREHIRNGNQLWVMDNNSKLDIRELELLIKDKEKLIVKDGLTPGERYITSPLAPPVDGMSVELQQEGKTQSGQKSQKGQKGQGKLKQAQSSNNG